jgi:hypothetical protein
LQLAQAAGLGKWQHNSSKISSSCTCRHQRLQDLQPQQLTKQLSVPQQLSAAQQVAGRQVCSKQLLQLLLLGSKDRSS